MITAQERWQQKVDYRIEVHLDVETHRFDGKQTLFYFNQSPDTLYKVFYHLYFNAFQPGSMMDVRSRELSDPDPRVRDRIFHLSEDEIGFIHADELMQDGQVVETKEVGTILEVTLNRPLLPNSVTNFEMKFNGQVPLQIRRSGRDNAEGISYSMSQWYPKLCEYDEQGWHANSYIAREFYGVWGNYDVKITLDSKFIVGATGQLLNADEIGYGYLDEKVNLRKKDILTWHFRAENVHDFVWAADPDYVHSNIRASDGTILHFFYQNEKKYRDAWEDLPEIMVRAWDIITRRYGSYPYPTYAFIQGGDGGMEYPMATLITGNRSIGSLVGVCIHEVMHSWFQMMLASNESLHAWMDEGFTTFSDTEVKNEMRKESIIAGTYTPNPFVSIFNGYRNLIKSGLEEPLSRPADHFSTNYAYSIASYTKGAIFLKQLEYIVGTEVFDKALLRYSRDWRFKHPNPNDVIRVFEKESGLELDWYKEYFVYSTDVIEYKVDSLYALDDKAVLQISRLGRMPMPIDILVTYADGSESYHTIPLRMMRGHKGVDQNISYKVEPDWPWVNPSYELILESPLDKIKSVHLDPTGRLADYDLSNNLIELERE